MLHSGRGWVYLKETAITVHHIDEIDMRTEYYMSQCIINVFLNIIFLVILIENGMTEKLVYRIVKLISNIKCLFKKSRV